MAELSISTGSSGGWTADADPLKASDQVLLKVALEGKTYQEALAEVRAAREGQEPAPGRETPRLDARSFLAVDVVEIQAVQVNLRLEDASGRRLEIAATSLTARTLSMRATAPAAPQAQAKDPLVIDLGGEGPTTTGAEGARAFDLAADGRTAPTSFARGATAFLALDRDGDGRITHGGELFGDQHGAVDGYAELAKFDANADGRIDAGDPVFDRLELLFGDGRRQTLGEASILSLDLGAVPQTGTTTGGDAIFARSLATRADGGTYGTYALGLRQFETTA